jgi:hypothetical protein
MHLELYTILNIAPVKLHHFLRRRLRNRTATAFTMVHYSNTLILAPPATIRNILDSYVAKAPREGRILAGALITTNMHGNSFIMKLSLITSI